MKYCVYPRATNSEKNHKNEQANIWLLVGQGYAQGENTVSKEMNLANEL